MSGEIGDNRQTGEEQTSAIEVLESRHAGVILRVRTSLKQNNCVDAQCFSAILNGVAH